MSNSLESLAGTLKAAKRKKRLVVAKTIEAKARLAEVESLVDQLGKEEEVVEEEMEEHVSLLEKKNSKIDDSICKHLPRSDAWK